VSTGRLRPKRFLLFKGNRYYEMGGADDYHGAFEDLQSAIDYIERAPVVEDAWAHIAMWGDDGLTPLLARANAWHTPGTPYRTYSVHQWQWWQR